MRHHADAHEKIITASKRAPRDQRLFLVADVNNKFDQNAVALHDGKVKLGYVSAGEAAKVRKILKKLAEAGQDQVIVVTHAPVKREGDFTWATSTNVKAVGHVYERIARKFAQGV